MNEVQNTDPDEVSRLCGARMSVTAGGVYRSWKWKDNDPSLGNVEIIDTVGITGKRVVDGPSLDDFIPKGEWPMDQFSRDDWHDVFAKPVPYPEGLPDDLIRSIAQLRLVLEEFAHLPEAIKANDHLRALMPLSLVSSSLRTISTKVGDLLEAADAKAQVAAEAPVEGW
jgi:hypothetical protein